MSKEFSSRLRQAFDFATMAEVARRLNVPHATVRNYYGGRLPAPEVLIKIANETDVSLNWLLTGKGDMLAGTTAPREPGRALERLINEIVDERIAARDASNSEIGSTRNAPEFDIETSVRRNNDPQRALSEWYEFDSVDAPDDYGVVFFRGWQTFTTEQKVEAVRDARRVLDRSR